ncbi:hypothetical protein K492DRAFT_164104 [Lichtheimia hyalospora FSU 10163]|nr:hypothetical protein K492DRAFT_164104 [Lichtheimia hyalospora FSU 10163]
MSVAGSTSSRGTHSRSRSRSRSRSPPLYNDTRNGPPRYPSRYDSYSYRPSRGPNAMDDYRDFRDRDRDRSSMGLREDRYIPRSRDRDMRYSRYYRDDMPPPPSHYPPPSLLPSREYSKSTPSIRREASPDRIIKDIKSSSAAVGASKEMKDDPRMPSNGSDSYTPPPPRYTEWRDRDRDRERRYRDDDHRWRDRDNYMMRYDSSGYGGSSGGNNNSSGGGPPPSYGPPFGGDSYRPDRDNRDRGIPSSPASTSGPSHLHYDRDRLDDRDFYRHSARNTMDSDRYRGRSSRPWAPISMSSSSNAGFPTGAPSGFKVRDRDREIRSPRNGSSPTNTPPWVTSRSNREDSKLDIRQDHPDKRPMSTNTQMSVDDEKEPGETSETDEMPEDVVMSNTATTINTAAPKDIQSSATVSSAVEPSSQPNLSADIPQSQSEPTLDDQPMQKIDTDTESKVKAEPVETTTTTTTAMDSTEATATEKEMTQQEIVERIGQIEDDIAMFEDMLVEISKRDDESKKDTVTMTTLSSTKENAMPYASTHEEQKEKDEHEIAKQQALEIINRDGQGQGITDIENMELKASPIMRKKPQLLINQVRTSDEEDDLLCEKLLKENQCVAKANSIMVGGWQGKPDDPENWSDEEKWCRPLYPRIDEYPCFQENIKRFEEIKTSLASSLASRQKDLEQKGKRLKREYKRHYETWKSKNLALDRIHDQKRRIPDRGSLYRSRRRVEEEPDDYVDGVIFNGDPFEGLRFGTDGTSGYSGGPNKGAWTSDAARSEAELLEIIQSLESADMRNPELRAAKTTATIPDMILDAKERIRTFDDRRGLVTDPLTYYHTGHDTGDVWSQQEMTAFMEGYMQYPKQFEKIAAAVGTKSAPQCVLFYYRKKTKIDFKALVSKGRRGKAGRKRDRLAEAVRRASGSAVYSTRKAKSKGSALMADIGEAQVSRKAKQKETERKAKDTRGLMDPNTYLEGVQERRRGKKPVIPASQLSTDDIDKTRGSTTDKRRNARRKGRSPKAASTGEGEEMYPDEPTIAETTNERTVAPTARWTEKDKEAAVDGFKRHGRDFVRVASLVGTKTEDQCRNFYHNYKRKFGPNAFNEESEAKSEFNTEEEDAAATLMGLHRMGTSSEQSSSPPPTSTPAHARTLSSQTESQKQSRTATTTAGRRRRARTSSGKVVDSEMMEEWMEAEFSGRGMRKTVSDTPTKRPAYSSYWSVSERSDFVRYLEQYGRDWKKVAEALASKTATQVRNFYMNNNEKMNLDQVIQRHQLAKQRERPPGLPYPSTSEPLSSAMQAHPTGYYTSPIAGQPPHLQTSGSSPVVPPPGMIHSYGGPPPTATTSAPSMYASPSSSSSSHVNASSFSPIHHHRSSPQPITSSSAYSSMSPHPHHHPSPPPSTAQQQQQQSSRTMSPSAPVTRVADLLNSDETNDTSSQKQNWESWFS